MFGFISHSEGTNRTQGSRLILWCWATCQELTSQGHTWSRSKLPHPIRWKITSCVRRSSSVFSENSQQGISVTATGQRQDHHRVWSLPQVWPHQVASDLCSRFLQVFYGKNVSRKIFQQQQWNQVNTISELFSWWILYENVGGESIHAIIWLRTSWNRLRKREVTNTVCRQPWQTDIRHNANSHPSSQWLKGTKVTIIIAQRGQPGLCSW